MKRYSFPRPIHHLYTSASDGLGHLNTEPHPLGSDTRVSLHINHYFKTISILFCSATHKSPASVARILAAAGSALLPLHPVDFVRTNRLQSRRTLDNMLLVR